jgi:signal transduction histidine kinase
MDRPIDRRERSKKLLRRYSPSLVVAVAAVVLLVAAFGWIRPSVGRSEIRTAIVERGRVEATITSSGTVVPLYEHVVTSPIDTRVTRIRKTPGDSLAAGERIVELDAGEARLALEKMDDRIALKQVEREQLKLDLAEQLNELKNRFLGMAAHDIRNPLGVILNYTEFLEDDKEKFTKDQVEFISHIKYLTSFILDMVNELLDVSTIDSGKVVLDIRKDDYIGFLLYQIQLFRTQL